jgi:hypothetical protein
VGIVRDGTHVFVAGYDSFPGDFRWRVEKRNFSDGSLNPSFGTGGVFLHDPSSNDDEANAIAVNPSFVFVGGIEKVPTNADSRWRVEKLNK